jgi:hypothetical protein
MFSKYVLRGLLWASASIVLAQDLKVADGVKLIDQKQRCQAK